MVSFRSIVLDFSAVAEALSKRVESPLSSGCVSLVVRFRFVADVPVVPSTGGGVSEPFVVAMLTCMGTFRAR